MKRQEHLATTGLYVIGTLLFSLAAIYNRFPLVYPDSGSYLQGLIEWAQLKRTPNFLQHFGWHPALATEPMADPWLGSRSSQYS
jgi:hypothetical protein